ncbi:ADP-ribosylglycohydrolase family protein [Propioniciclava coleopterorum]|uniref:ADP-ribosylglycohydrolase family protein n=1 Tax=Propioniciclava coleopterorum TaxID=2714937 RepID=A0A6G7Y595_9ACTN|nr:ADP-ribosylglycohydrolase family protein [Propioniciclava coleopterorum]QIK71953.1 ADP-ribosylglycohydrolase family protein [Propioniciclava coleopterorum]
MRLTWVQPEDLLLHAFVQAMDEGTDVDDLREEWLAAGGTLDAPVSGAAPTPASAANRALARRLLVEVEARGVVRVESDPEEIFERAAEPPPLPTSASDDRILGAWLGRAAGCLLGKPVEKIPREGIRAILEDLGEWPLTRYFTEVGLDPAIARRHPWNRRSRPTSLRENIAGMPEDDDLNYPLLNLALLETLGQDFTVDDVATAWLANLPAGRVFTAERVAYRNLLQGIEPARAGSTDNPFREWIGALIRGDVFGWTHPGRPQDAAMLAFTDARLSHVREGIYGEMWVAGACAAAVVADDLETVLAAGASCVPADSALLRAIEFGVELGAVPDRDDALDALHDVYGRHHWVHVLNNAATIGWALASAVGPDGRPDFGAAIANAVMAGWDTDSAGATVGSIAGGLAGAAALPRAWVEPLRDRYATSLPGFDGVSFTELAARTQTLARRFA